jgi:hypothetical protein
MATKFTLHFEVELEDEQVAQVVKIARDAYSSGGGASALVGDEERPIPSEDFIRYPEQALMELIERNPLLEQADILVDTVSCRREDGRPVESDEPENLSEDELDEEDSGVYVCRWPNGDCSVVMAGSKREAVMALDEWDAADPSWLTPVDACLIDFRLNNRGEIELAQFGEETANFVWERCYPVLDEVRTRYLDDRCRRAKDQIKRAVRQERNRLRGNKPLALSATTEVGRELQRRLGAAGPVADHYVEQFASQLLKSSVGNKGKPS